MNKFDSNYMKVLLAEEEENDVPALYKRVGVLEKNLSDLEGKYRTLLSVVSTNTLCMCDMTKVMTTTAKNIENTTNSQQKTEKQK